MPQRLALTIKGRRTAVAAGSGRRQSPHDERSIVAVLVSALGTSPSDEDRADWLAMSPAQRQKALLRISTLRQWTDDRGDLTLETAAARTGVTAKRFYEMASAWRKRRSLAALGVFARSRDRSSRLDARAVNLLQSLLPRVVGADPTRSVDALRKSLVEQVEAVAAMSPLEPALRVPSKMVVRRMIERELARLGAEALAGHDVAFDCCPLSLVDDAGYRFTLFAVVDRATGLLLGVSLGRLADSVAGFADAASDALVRIPRLEGAGNWADATQRVELSADPNADGDALAAAITAVPGGPALGVATGTPGRYLRAALGDRLGRAEFRAGISLTRGQPVSASPTYTPAAARLEIMNGTQAHNAALVGRAGNPAQPPENLFALLRSVAALRAVRGR